MKVGEGHTVARQLLYWAPRSMCLLFAAFLSLFALDVFNEGYGFWRTLVALFMHLVPVWIVLITLAVIWRREWLGALLFPILGILYLIGTWGNVHWTAQIVIPGPLLLMGLLFAANWRYRNMRTKT